MSLRPSTVAQVPRPGAARPRAASPPAIVSPRRLPIGSRTGLSNPKGASTDLPASKITGEPSKLLTRSEPVRIHRPQFSTPPKPALSATATVKPAPSPSRHDQAQARADLEAQDRINRTRLAPRAKLGVSKVSGLEHLKNPKVRPRLPGGRPGLFARTSPPAAGRPAALSQAPISVAPKLAAEAAVAEKIRAVNAPTSEPLLANGPEISHAAPLVEQKRQEIPPPQGLVQELPTEEKAGGMERLAFMLIAGAVAFVALKGA